MKNIKDDEGTIIKYSPPLTDVEVVKSIEDCDFDKEILKYIEANIEEVKRIIG